MKQSMDIMINRIVEILSKNKPAICLFGSVVLDDFKLGWSDIDFLCLTEKTITTEQAGILINLRQILLEEYPANPYFRSFEGGFLTAEAFFSKEKDTVVYWGTSGERLTDTFSLCPFSTIEIIEYGKMLYGIDFRNKFTYPTEEEIFDAVQNHYNTLRNYAQQTGESIKSVGWLLDISRCLYTLKTMKVIAKTKAATWAVEENLPPNPCVLEKAIEIRKKPKAYEHDEGTLKWCATLGDEIQKYANILELQLQTV